MKTRIQNLLITLALASTTCQIQASTVFPIATNATDIALIGGVASSGSNYLVVFNRNNTNVCAQLVSTNGALVGPLLTLGSSKGGARVASGKTNYLVIWGDDHAPPATVDLFGQIISSSGGKIGSAFPLLSSLGSHGFQGEGPVAFDGTNFLTVWEDNKGARNSAYYGQLLTSSGALVGSEFLIAGGQNENATGALAIGATNSLFVWQTRANPAVTYGVFISRGGAVGSAFQISQTHSPRYNPLAVGFNGTNYLTIWNRDTGAGNPSPALWNLDARLIAPNGTFLGDQFALVTNYAVQPSVSFDGANYLLSWSSTYSAGTILFQFLSPSANPVGPAFTVFQSQGTNSPLFGVSVFDGFRFGLGGVLGSLGVNANTGSVTSIFSGAIYGAIVSASTTQPTLVASNRLGTEFSLQLSGTPGINYAIQMITNLTVTNWTALVTNSPTNGAFSFTDVSATNTSRFYRALKR